MLWVWLLALASHPVGAWVYATRHDTMRDQVSQVAGLEALNSPAGARAILTETRTNGHAVVQLLVDGGISDCASDCRILVRINGEPARYWGAGSTPSARGFVLTMGAPRDEHGESEFDAPAEIARASEIRIEVPFYLHGAYQYRFVTSSPIRW